jgi:hypothetical protein
MESEFFWGKILKNWIEAVNVINLIRFQVTADEKTGWFFLKPQNSRPG